MEEIDIVKEFVIESSENLSRLDREMVELEQRPDNASLLASIFRTIHTIKGTCGFLGFTVLERITHHAENILSQVRNGDRELTLELVSLILETVDAVKAELTSIEATSRESGELYADLQERQEQAASAIPPKPAKSDPTGPFPVAAAEVESDTTVSQPTEDSNSEPKGADHEALIAQKSGVSVADSTIRVDVGMLDKLMNLVGELVLARNQILQYTTLQDDATLNATSQRLNLITTELQGSVMKTRMQPIGMVWGKLPRVVRDLANSCGKQIALEMDGAGTELDKTIIEAIKDPLTHIVRNACDHGIEKPDIRTAAGKPAQGKLVLRAYHEGGNVNIEIADDGAGIDPEKIKRSVIQKGLMRPEQVERMQPRELVNLTFLPGFSTAQKVSSISGRGVGMDVVKTNIEKIGGTVDLASRPGHGVTVKIKIPLTLAIIPGLVISSGEERFVIPQVSLLELVRLEGAAGEKQIQRIHGTPVYRRRGRLLPLAYMNELLHLAPQNAGAAPDVVNIVVLQAEDRRFGLVVDGINDTQEIVVKPLGKRLKGVDCYAGATIMGDGKVALILDVLGIARLSGVMGESRSALPGEGSAEQAIAGNPRQSLLLFRAGTLHRLAVPLSLVARLEEFPRSKIEYAAGKMVVQYRDQILPLIHLSAEFAEPGSEKSALHQDPVQAIVFADGGRRVGLLVDQILDIVEDTILVKKASQRSGVLGSAVVGQKITDFLDLHWVIERVDEQWFQTRADGATGTTVMVTENSGFARGLLRNNLEMAGHRVVEASSASEAIDQLSKETVHVIVAALDLPNRNAIELLDAMEKQPALSRIPVVALANRSENGDLPEPDGRFAVYSPKFDGTALLRSVGRLAHALEHADEKTTAQDSMAGQEA
jgi:two-component system, chemotaxis family, sensor kinase CheA